MINLERTLEIYAGRPLSDNEYTFSGDENGIELTFWGLETEPPTMAQLESISQTDEYLERG